MPVTELGASPETAYPVRELSARIAERLRTWPRIWVEGQISEIRQRNQLVFITLRDADSEMSIPVVTAPSLVQGIDRGNRVAALLGTEWWTRNGQVQFRAHAIQPVGVGELLIRLEKLRALLTAEGLFAPERKRPLPVLPNCIGLICGRNSEALHDVVTNATKRWPHVRFEIAEVAVQGPAAVQQVSEKVREFEANKDIDVIVIARGGGSFEDLLPFSDEGLLREVAKCFTPVVSAIGHEQDRPLLDDVADLREATAALMDRRGWAHEARAAERTAMIASLVVPGADAGPAPRTGPFTLTASVWRVDDATAARVDALLERLADSGHTVAVAEAVTVTVTGDAHFPVSTGSRKYITIPTKGRKLSEVRTELKAKLESIRLQAGPLMTLGDVKARVVPKMCLISPPRHGGVVHTRTFIPHVCHAAIGVLGAVSVATACVLPGTVADGVAQLPAGSQAYSVEHPSGEFTVTLEIDRSGPTPEVRRAGLVRTARLLSRGEVLIPEGIWDGKTGR